MVAMLVTAIGLAMGTAVSGSGLPMAAMHRFNKQSLPTSSSSSASNTECKAIANTTACAPYTTGLYINTTAVAALYGLDAGSATPAADWDAVLRAATGGGRNGSELFGATLGCPGLSALPYLLSFLCLRDIFVASADCNDLRSAPLPSPPIASAVCESFQSQAEVLIADPENCPNTDNLVFLSTRNAIVNGSDADSCSNLTTAWADALKSENITAKPVNGVELDLNTCGELI
ncbi:hypothetical protein HK100_002172 [Physocladia obscura]|uniref:Uncharacterized protein n=1 Tax=Physocladia obscura TaxID=109957 RepID=A0AAD5SVR3_9FUNG|nr:hypothetical protein HK100_002172 [Physocladia obscura]